MSLFLSLKIQFYYDTIYNKLMIKYLIKFSNYSIKFYLQQSL